MHVSSSRLTSRLAMSAWKDGRTISQPIKKSELALGGIFKG